MYVAKKHQRECHSWVWIVLAQYTPYTISAKEQPKSSLYAVLIPNSTQGSSRVQLGLVRWDVREDFRFSGTCLPVHLTGCGRPYIYVVRWTWVPYNWAINIKNCEINWGFLLDVRPAKMPKWVNQWKTGACAELMLVVSLNRMASGHWESQSTTVRRWVWPLVHIMLSNNVIT